MYGVEEGAWLEMMVVPLLLLVVVVPLVQSVVPFVQSVVVVPLVPSVVVPQQRGRGDEGGAVHPGWPENGAAMKETLDVNTYQIKTMPY